MSTRVRMTGTQRREQLLDVGRSLFAERGYDGTAVEEIALRAGVSKPVVYEHFGGKEGLYAVVVDREVSRLMEMFASALSGDSPKVLLELEYPAAAIGLRVTTNSLENAEAVVKRVAEDMDLRVSEGYQLAVHPDVLAFDAHGDCSPGGSGSRRGPG